jgi:hypothetical protein
MTTSLLEISAKRQPAEVMLAGLLDKNMAASLAAGQNLIQTAKSAGLNMTDYLTLAVDTTQGKFAGLGLNGFEAALAYLNLPIKDDFANGVTLQAAAETFQTYPGTRAMFPPVIDSMLQWSYRQQNIENIGSIVGQSRNINGNEMITTVVSDTDADYQQTGVIAEGSNIPVRSIRTTENGVKIYKLGGGVRFTYEFERRASLDVVTPYAARMQREVEIGQVALATAMLINGDGVSGAAPVVTATTLAGTIPTPPTVVAGRMDWEVFLKWLVTRAQAGVPVDTVLGNYDVYFEWLRMFSKPSIAQGMTQTEVLAKAGVQTAIENPRFNFNVDFALSSTAPASKVLGFIKNETIEELVENGSDIEESARSITNQTVQYNKTVNKGYKLTFSDTRSILHLV